MSKSDISREDYIYIREILTKLPVNPGDAGQCLTIPLGELIQLKEGIIDPPLTLVKTLKRLFKNTAIEAEIDIHLVKPFQGDKGTIGK